MDAELVTLAESASRTLVQTVATGGWQLASRGLARLFGRGDTKREADEAAALETAAASGQSPDVLAARWQGRLEALLDERPDLAAELTALVGAVQAAPGAQTAIAHDHANQAVQYQGVQHNTFGTADDRDDGQHPEAQHRSQQANLQFGRQYNTFIGREERRTGVLLTVPERVLAAENLRGRQVLIARISTRWQPGIIVLHGIGGSGKTTLAIELAHRAVAEHHAATWLIHADDRTSLDAGMRTLAYTVGGGEAEIRHQHTADVLWRHLDARTDPWLLLIDNADDVSLFADSGYLRTPGPAGLIIVISRDRSWPAFVRPHPVDALEPADGGRALLDRAPRAGDHASAQRLSERLGNLPLALDLAGSYLAEAGRSVFPAPDAVTTFDGYLSTFDTRLAELSDSRATGEAAKRRTILTTWELSLDLLARAGRPLARPLLRLLASFGPFPVPYVLLLDPDELAASPLLPDTLERTDIDQALRDLDRLRLVTLALPGHRPGNEYTARLHPLVRAAARHHIATGHESTEYHTLVWTLLRRAVRSDELGPPEELSSAWRLWELVTPHITDLFAAVVAAPQNHPVGSCVTAVIWAGRFLNAKGQYESARRLLAESEPLAAAALGPEHPGTVIVRHNLATALLSLGHAGLAEQLYRSVLAIRERTLGPSDANTLTTRHNLARALQAQGHLDQAVPLYRSVLTSRERIFGPRHTNTLITRHNLARALQAQGHLDQAEQIYRTTLTTLENTPGPSQLDTFVTLFHLAGALHAQGDLDRAELMYRNTFATFDSAFGPDHPNTLTVAHNLAGTLHDLGEVTEALQLMRDIVTRAERALGTDHRITTSSRRRLQNWTNNT